SSFLFMIRLPPRPTPFPYTTLFRSARQEAQARLDALRRLQQSRARGVLAERDELGAHEIGQRRLRQQLRLCGRCLRLRRRRVCIDRKSTRLNSSHVKISYAVFCLKK